MKSKLTWLLPVLGMCILFWAVNSAGAAPIVYKQTMTKILDETQFQGWPPDFETYTRYFNNLTNSADGSRIGFYVDCWAYTTYRHTYVANADGSGIIELTDHFPAAVTPLWTAVNFKLDDTGSRLFFRAPNVGSDFNFYYFDLTSLVCSEAVDRSGEIYAIHYLDGRKPYTLTTIGGQTTLFFRHRAGWDPVAERHIQGIYSAPVGGAATKVMDINQLPGDENMNLLGFLGSAPNANRLLLYWTDVNSTPGGAMWQTTGPARVPDEMHDSVWDGQNLYNNIISADGNKALYKYRDNAATTSYLYHVNLNSGVKTFIAQTDRVAGFSANAMAPSGNYAFYSSQYNKRTRFHLATGDRRDTLSQYFPESSASGEFLLSDITTDDRYYFIGSKLDIARIHRVDMAPTNFSQAPNITAISFNTARLLNDGTTRATVMATVTDAQGLGTITAVRLKTLVDGLEAPEWLLGGDPFIYSGFMYDDGTHGDLVAGDGIFTNDTIQTNPSSNFYTRFSLPKQVGIRIVAQDADHNYVMADTSITVVNNMNSPCEPALNLLLLD